MVGEGSFKRRMTLSRPTLSVVAVRRLAGPTTRHHQQKRDELVRPDKALQGSPGYRGAGYDIWLAQAPLKMTIGPQPWQSPPAW